jgi:hypothetical protein
MSGKISQPTHADRAYALLANAPLTDAEGTRLRRFIVQEGDARAMRALGVSRSAAMRAASGLGITPYIRAKILAALDLEAQGIR